MFSPAHLMAFPGNSVPNLDSLRWQNRVVLILSERSDDPRIAEQQRIFASQSQGLTERDMKVFSVTADSEEGRQLQHRVHASGKPFVIILIGKDGSVKLRKERPVEVDELFKLIDRMPMRQEEMKRQ